MQSLLIMLKKCTHLISASHHKLSCSIIYSDNLSHGSGPWGHGQYALVFSVTCMEQMNAQKLLANQGEGMKAFHYLCNNSLMCCFFSLQAAIMRQVRCLYVTALFEFQPTCKPTAWMGGNNVSLARKYGRRWQRNWHSFGQSLHPSRAFARESLMEMGSVATPLQGAVCVYLTTYNEKTWRDSHEQDSHEQAVKEANNEWRKSGMIFFKLSFLFLSWRPSEVIVGWQCQKNWT